jgi:hypothetical protein
MECFPWKHPADSLLEVSVWQHLTKMVNDGRCIFSSGHDFQKIHEIARETLRTAQETMKRDYDSKMREVEYQPGDFVYVLDTAHIKGRAKKLDPEHHFVWRHSSMSIY